MANILHPQAHRKRYPDHDTFLKVDGDDYPLNWREVFTAFTGDFGYHCTRCDYRHDVRPSLAKLGSFQVYPGQYLRWVLGKDALNSSQLYMQRLLQLALEGRVNTAQRVISAGRLLRISGPEIDAVAQSLRAEQARLQLA